MKKVVAFALFLVFVAAVPTSGEIPKQINYQGILTDTEGDPITEEGVLMSFRVYDHLTAGTLLWSTTDKPVDVSGGMFNVILGEYRPGEEETMSLPFDQPYFLEIEVGSDVMSPRMSLSPAPYSLSSRGVSGDSNTFPADGYVGVGKLDPVRNMNIFEDKNGNVGIGIDNPNGGNMASEAIEFLDGQSIRGYLKYNGTGSGYPYQLHLKNLYSGGSIAIGVSGMTNAIKVASDGKIGLGLYNPSEKLEVSGAIRLGDSDAPIPGNPGTIRWTGSDFLGCTVAGTWISLTSTVGGGGGGWTDDGTAVRLTSSSDRVGIGTSSPVFKLHATDNNRFTPTVKGENTFNNTSGYLGSGESEPYGVIGKNETGNNSGFLGGLEYAVYAENKDGEDNDVSYGYIGGADKGVFGAYKVNLSQFNYGSLGEQTSGVYGYSAESNGIMGESATGYGVYARVTNVFTSAIYAENSAGGPAGEFHGKVKIVGEASSLAAMEIHGNIHIHNPSSGELVMQLGDGLDYAEGFDVSETEEIRAGSVLVIDSDNPGELKLSELSYDRKVVGIVAGANNLGSGVRLGAGRFDCDVALAGRVYCYADATEEAIKPGDLLTTSSTPGHAMKASDHTKAHGAILGKAMEGLPKGKKGQILVLVTLQ